MALNTQKILFNLKQATRRNNAKYNSKMKLQHTPKIEQKKNATNRAKTIIILIFTSKQNKHDQVAQFARQKEQVMPYGKSMKLSSLPDERT